MTSEYSDVPPGLFTKYKGCNKKILDVLGLDTSYPPCKCEDCDEPIETKLIGDWKGNIFE